eukprot:TRINITY_DN50331_c0_g1_i1.p1 TRINITY_DN50331_c0_g1~~TRINITY_DN50331_c0_g1_i1.p1  ORF type:complete len:615 (-),score=40.82 TRINITY_DN50331_c0_g1_i1:41-1885(-)
MGQSRSYFLRFLLGFNPLTPHVFRTSAALFFVWLSSSVCCVMASRNNSVGGGILDRLVRGLRLMARLQSPKSLFAGFGALLGVIFSRLLFASLRESLAVMNLCELDLDPELKRKFEEMTSRPKWGRGMPRSPPPGVWRQYLHAHMNPEENLTEIHSALGLVSRVPEQMTLDQITEGVRRVMKQKYFDLILATDRYWNEDQARTIALSLAADCRLQFPLARGGMEEVVEDKFISQLPWPAPQRIQLLLRLALSTLRPLFLSVLSWESRYVDTPFGPMHVYDTKPSHSHHKQPPLILQHGMFVTGWSMALLGWLLTRRGRRVIIPDLFDFDHGLSASKRMKEGPDGWTPEKVRRASESVESLICVVQDLLQGGATAVDLVGHSYGGFLIGCLANRCERERLPVRKVVLLGPGGPATSISPSAAAVSFMVDPMKEIEMRRLRLLPDSPVKLAVASCLGVLLGPNNVNILCGNRYAEFLALKKWGASCPTLVLWGDKDSTARPRVTAELIPFLRRCFPQLDAFWVEGGSHNIQVDSVLSLTEKIDGWLNKSCNSREAVDGDASEGGSFSGAYLGIPEASLVLTRRRLREITVSDLQDPRLALPHIGAMPYAKRLQANL